MTLRQANFGQCGSAEVANRSRQMHRVPERRKRGVKEPTAKVNAAQYSDGAALKPFVAILFGELDAPVYVLFGLVIPAHRQQQLSLSLPARRLMARLIEAQGNFNCRIQQG